jgi:PmbA protein
LEEDNEMEMTELAVSKALELKATEAEAYVQRAKNIKVEFGQEIETFKTTESIGIGLRVALGKKTAIYSTSILNDKEVAEAAKKAVRIAKVAPEDPDWKHLNRKFGGTSVEGYYDRELETIEYREIVDRLSSSAKLIKDYDKRAKPTRGILTLSASKVSIANSYGQSADRRETSIVVSIRVKANDSGMESTGNEHQEARYWKEVDFEDLAVKAADKAVKFLRAKPMRGGKTAVIIRNQIFANLLGIFFGYPISADWIQKGKSPLAGKLGTAIASENVTLVDDGTMQYGWGTRPFDDEGCPTQRTPVIEKGVLKNFLYDTYTALKASAKSTGNAQRAGYWLKPQPLPSNLLLKTGGADPEEMIRDTKRGIYVDTTIGEWLSNPVSGNLNATITHGYRVENGELTEPVKGIVISGNFYELLKKGVQSIGKDLSNSAEVYCPTVKLDEVTIAGE